MEPRFITISEKKLVGKRIRMSLSANLTAELWQSFMPGRKEIRNKKNADLFSIEVYDQNLDFNDFNPTTEFEKWAAIEVTEFDTVPAGMEAFALTEGLYAVFIYQGAANNSASFFQYIFETWLPQSGYLLDQRARFEVMGEKYKGNDPDSEEEIWIPIKLKKLQPEFTS